MSHCTTGSVVSRDEDLMCRVRGRLLGCRYFPPVSWKAIGGGRISCRADAFHKSPGRRSGASSAPRLSHGGGAPEPAPDPGYPPDLNRKRSPSRPNSCLASWSCRLRWETNRCPTWGGRASADEAGALLAASGCGWRVSGDASVGVWKGREVSRLSSGGMAAWRLCWLRGENTGRRLLLGGCDEVERWIMECRCRSAEAAAAPCRARGGRRRKRMGANTRLGASRWMPLCRARMSRGRYPGTLRRCSGEDRDVAKVAEVRISVFLPIRWRRHAGSRHHGGPEGSAACGSFFSSSGIIPSCTPL